MTSDHTFRNAFLAAACTATVAGTSAVAGWKLFEFDAALLFYAQALIIALSLTVYRFVIWVHRPPTSVLYRQAFQMASRATNLRSLLWHVLTRGIGYFALNRFVWVRAKTRWAAHWHIAVGCGMATAIVFPLIFGWVWFETPANDLTSYQVMLFGFHLKTISVDGLEAFLAFHGLVWASFPVMLGTSMAIGRRLTDRGDRATQSLTYDLLPLLLLQSIAITGLLMTVSYSFFRGFLHTPIATLHFIAVVGTILWLPYSKLFHIPQRTLKLAHFVYEHQSKSSGQARCQRCNDEYADRAQIANLIEIQRRLGYRYDLKNGTHYQSVCPPCRRAVMVIAQGRRWRSGWAESANSLQAVK